MSRYYHTVVSCFIILPLFLLLSLPLTSCTTKTHLTSEHDDTPPLVSLDINGVELKDKENPTRFNNTHLSSLIRVHGSAMDEDSGIRDIAVGVNLKLKCGITKEIMFHGNSNNVDWNPNAVYSGEKVTKKISDTYNFRLWYLQKRCGRLPLVKAEGDVYITARNYFGQITTKHYPVIFTPSSWQ